MKRNEIIALLNEITIYTKDETTKGVLKKITNLTLNNNVTLPWAVSQMKDYLAFNNLLEETPEYLHN